MAKCPTHIVETHLLIYVGVLISAVQTGSASYVYPCCNRVRHRNSGVVCALPYLPLPLTRMFLFRSITLSISSCFVSSSMKQAHASGKIPRTMNRREGRETDEEVLVARAIDRVLRPLFPPGYCFETQVLHPMLKRSSS